MFKKLSGMVSDARLKAGVPNAPPPSPQIHTMMNDENFVRILNPKEKYALESFVKVTWDFLGSRWEENYKKVVADMLQSYQALGARMSLRTHFFHPHLDFFQENLGNVSVGKGSIRTSL